MNLIVVVVVEVVEIVVEIVVENVKNAFDSLLHPFEKIYLNENQVALMKKDLLDDEMNYWKNNKTNKIKIKLK